MTKLYEIFIILIIVNFCLQEECVFDGGTCSKAADATFEPKEKICVLNSGNNGCILRQIQCSDITSPVSCTGIILPSKYRICLYDEEKSCIEVNKECVDVHEKNDCVGYSPNSLIKCAWDDAKGCFDTSCEDMEVDKCESYIPVDSSKQCSLDSSTNKCKEISKPNNNNLAFQIKYSIILLISLIFLL